jgi:hypothetical protein
MRSAAQMRLLALVAVLAVASGWPWLWADDHKNKVHKPGPSAKTIVPKPLSEHVLKGLKFLVEQQQANGGWSQGEESAAMGNTGNSVRDIPNVADTCIATLALIRSGNSPREGPFALNVARALDFICGQVEKSDETSLFVTGVRGTRVQGKLGPYVDTFLTTLVFSELKGKMADDKGEKRLAAALSKTVAKIQKNQKDNGTWANEGWAPILSQSLASKGLNRASQFGFAVPESVLAKAESFAKANTGPISARAGTAVALGGRSGSLGGGSLEYRGSPALAGLGRAGPVMAAGSVDSAALGSAGVPLYDRASNFGALQDSINTNRLAEKAAREVLASPTASKDDKKQAKERLDRFAEAEKTYNQSAASFLRQLDDKNFLRGFGSNGGEEFLSYMNISETLLAQGGKEWKLWDIAISDNLVRIQNKDGSWTGSHCITGRTFCTAAALLVLMADRAPIPVRTTSSK